MRIAREWLVRLRSMWRPIRSDADIEQELQFHAELAGERGVTQTLDAMRDQRELPWLRDFGRDVNYAVRTLQRSPGFTAVAVLTLGLGVGATTAIASVVDKILLQPLPFPDSDRLVRIVENVPSTVAGRPPSQRGVTYQEFQEWRTRSRTLADAFAVAFSETNVRTADGVARLWGGAVSPNTFAVLKTRALLGRTLDPSDDASPNVVVLSFDTWRRRFRADPAVVGTTVEFRADFNASATFERDPPRLMTIVGVLRPDFELPTGPAEYLAPVAIDSSKRSPGVTLVGVLRAGISQQAAVEEANLIGGAIRPPRPANAPPLTGPRFDVLSLKNQIVQELRPALRVLLAAVAFVLLIVCSNVANLLLARGSARQREMAVRFAIGANRGRVVRQLLTESVVLAGAGGVLGAVLGAAGVSLVQALASVDAPGIFRLGFGTSVLPRGHEVGIDLRMFGIAFSIAALTSFVFGVVPAFHVSRASAAQAMMPRGSGAGRRESRIRTALVVGQLVMATVLLVAAGLLAHSFVRLSTVERGYDPAKVLALQLVFPPEYSIARKTETIDALLARLRANPAVESAGFTRAGILIGEAITIGTFVPPGRTVEEMRGSAVRPLIRPVSAGYLSAVGSRLLEGREFDASDTATSAPAIVISRSVARQYFGASSAIGQVVNWHSAFGGPGTTPVKDIVSPLRVVGVVEDVRNTSPDRAGNPEIFLEYRQMLALQRLWGDSTHRQEMTSIGFLSFAIRARETPEALGPMVGDIVRAVDPNVGIDAMIPMASLAATSIARPRFYAVLLGVFAGVAGLLAAVGIYGVLAYAVVQRTQEIGIRMALGAQRMQVLALVLRKGLMLAAVGILLGVVGAAASARLLQSMLFGVTPLDATTFVVVAALFGAVALVACYLPARRATKVDPIVALRAE